MSTTKNNHYISEYLLNSWLIKKGKVRVFDYAKSTFEDRDTETLFSKQYLFTQAQEIFFNKYIESIAKQELSTIWEKEFKTKKWKNYRAILLFIFDLIGRYTAAQNGKKESVEFITSLDDEKLNQLALAIDSKYSVGVLTVPGDGRLCFPSNLIIPIFDPTLKECHFGIPFNGNNCLFLLKKGYDQEYLNSISKNHTVINLSAGNHRTDLIVIHPDCLHDEAGLAQKLIDQREKNQRLANQIGQLLEIVRGFQESTGIRLLSS